MLLFSATVVEMFPSQKIKSHLRCSQSHLRCSHHKALPGVYSAQSMGLGGGFLLTHFDAKSGLVEALDAREAAPRASHEGMFQ